MNDAPLPPVGTTGVTSALALHGSDDVAMALRDLKAGERIWVQGPGERVELELVENIPLCHKVALRTLAPGQPIRKYGEVIGMTTQAAVAGSHVHVHNLKSLRGLV